VPSAHLGDGISTEKSAKVTEVNGDTELENRAMPGGGCYLSLFKVGR
jgi:hypothetical protein